MHRTRPTTSAPIAVALALIVAVAACTGGGATVPGTTATPAAPGSPGPSGPHRSAGPSAEPSPAASAPGVELTQAWATVELTDVRTGESFRIADLVAEGRVVFIETMAIWCTNCRRQQGDVVTALDQLDPASVTWIGVDVDPSEEADALAEYSRALGFDWPFVVAGADLSRALAADFGDGVLSPPSTPIIVVGTDGRVTLTEFGHKSVDRILALAAEHGA